MRSRRRFAWSLAGGVLAIAFAGAAYADLIVDTGDAGQQSFGWTLDAEYWLAGEITLNAAYIITSIQGWMYEVDSGPLTIALYDDGGMVPGTNELFSATFIADGPDLIPGQAPTNTWIGTDGLGWQLDPGTYWVAFEVRAGDTWFAMPYPAADPLEHYAGHIPYDADFISGFGLRVYGTPVVPEPASLVLVALGLAGIVARRKAAAHNKTD